MINIDYKNTVAVVELRRGKTNALDLELVGNLQKSLQQLKADPGVRGVVLASASEKFFSIGFDIPQLFELARENFRVFYHDFNQVCLELYTLPKPTIAAINGHAVAGGCILTLCCDYRFIGQGRKFMGLNEIKLGVPVPYLADWVLRSLVGTRNARDMTETGEFYLPQKLVDLGLVDLILPTEELLARSVDKAQVLGSMPTDAYAVIKQDRVESIAAQVRKYTKEKEELFLNCWYLDEARQRLQEAMEKF